MHPLIFQTKYFTLHTIWLFLALAIITGTYALIKLSLNNNLKIQFLSTNSWKLILWALVGARIVAIVTNFRMYFYEFGLKEIPPLFYIWDKELSLWGGAIGFLLYLHFICKKSDQKFWRWLDVIVPAGIAAFAVVHMGAFFGGLNYGAPTSLPWGVNFASPLVRYTVPIHPTQIYAFLYSALLVVVLIGIQNSKKFDTQKDTGLLGLFGIFAYSILRFLEDFVRGDDTILILGVRLTKITIPVLIILTGVIIYLRYNKLREKQTIFNKLKRCKQ